MSNLKVAVCVPHMEKVPARFWLCMQNLSSELAETFLLPWCCSYIHSARNQLARSALQGGATHVLFVDSDMTFPPAVTIDRLLSWNKEIVGATYVTRAPDHALCCENSTKAQKGFREGQELVEMIALPTGLMMIEAGVFAKLKKPWFRAEVVEECEEYPDGLEIGDDVGFCRRAVQAGVRIWCDVPLSMVVGHLGIEEYKVDPARFRPQSMPSPVHGTPPVGLPGNAAGFSETLLQGRTA